MFQAYERAFEANEKAFEKCLIEEIERLAKAVIESYPRAKSFCMGMGSVSFHCQWVEHDGDDTYECDEHESPWVIERLNPHALELASLLSKWDDRFKLTGYPMHIDRDNVTGELVTSNDW